MGNFVHYLSPRWYQCDDVPFEFIPTLSTHQVPATVLNSWCGILSGHTSLDIVQTPLTVPIGTGVDILSSVPKDVSGIFKVEPRTEIQVVTAAFGLGVSSFPASQPVWKRRL